MSLFLPSDVRHSSLARTHTHTHEISTEPDLFSSFNSKTIIYPYGTAHSDDGSDRSGVYGIRPYMFTCLNPNPTRSSRLAQPAPPTGDRCRTGGLSAAVIGYEATRWRCCPKPLRCPEMRAGGRTATHLTQF